ncbi:MAG: ABC transporter permease [Fuerstiella sp.]
MNTEHAGSRVWKSLANDYGMIFVLLLMVVVLSALTLEEQSPVGREAGKRVADEIISRLGTEVTVVIVAEATPVDEAFVQGASERLQAAGLAIAAEVSGRPVDARRTMEEVLSDGGRIDAVAATADTVRWTIYDRFEGLSTDRCFSPESYTWPTFARLDNLLSVANQTAIYAIIAIGMTMVIITAGIDLSVGSLVALASVTAALIIRDSGGREAGVGGMLAGCLAGVAVCAVAGLFNGLMNTRFGIPPFIATLAMMMVARGLARRLSGELSIQQLPDSYLWIGGGTTLGIPNPVILMILLYGIAHVVMSMTVFGRYVYSVGGNAEAARLSGVPVKTVTLVVYTLCGALAGLGGIVQSSKLGSGDPKLGLMFELDVIAAAVVGGTSLMGGEGRIFGTLIGAFIIAVIKNGMNLMNVGAPDQQIVLGGVVLVAVLVDTLKRRGAKS